MHEICAFSSWFVWAQHCDVFVSISALCAAWLPLLTAADCERLWGCHSGKVLLIGSMFVSPLLSACCPAPLTSRNILMCVFDTVRGHSCSHVSHLSPLPHLSCLLLQSRFLRRFFFLCGCFIIINMLPLCVWEGKLSKLNFCFTRSRAVIVFLLKC